MPWFDEAVLSSVVEASTSGWCAASALAFNMRPASDHIACLVILKCVGRIGLGKGEGKIVKAAFDKEMEFLSCLEDKTRS